MSNYLNHLVVLDGSLDIITNGTRLDICSAQPTTRDTAISLSLANTTLSGADYSKSEGNTSGRKVTIAQKLAIPITTTGIATHVAISDNTNLLLVVTCVSQNLASGGTVTTPAFNCELADPI